SELVPAHCRLEFPTTNCSESLRFRRFPLSRGSTIYTFQKNSRSGFLTGEYVPGGGTGNHNSLFGVGCQCHLWDNPTHRSRCQSYAASLSDAERYSSGVSQN